MSDESDQAPEALPSTLPKTQSTKWIIWSGGISLVIAVLCLGGTVISMQASLRAYLNFMTEPTPQDLANITIFGRIISFVVIPLALLGIVLFVAGLITRRPAATAETRQPFQFSIRTLMIVTVAFAVTLSIITQISSPLIGIIIPMVLYFGCIIILRRNTPPSFWEKRQRWIPVISLLFIPVLLVGVWSFYILIYPFESKPGAEPIGIFPFFLASSIVAGLFFTVTLAIVFRINPSARMSDDQTHRMNGPEVLFPWVFFIGSFILLCLIKDQGVLFEFSEQWFISHFFLASIVAPFVWLGTAGIRSTKLRVTAFVVQYIVGFFVYIYLSLLHWLGWSIAAL